MVVAYESGEGSYEAIALRFAIGPASVNRWVRLKRSRGSLAPQPKGGGTPSTISGDEIAALLSELGDPAAGELTAALNKRRRRSDRVHVSSTKRALHRHGYVIKKNADGRWRVSAPMS
jgi:transposase